jgi:hypothetical protein
VTESQLLGLSAGGTAESMHLDAAATSAAAQLREAKQQRHRDMGGACSDPAGRALSKRTLAAGAHRSDSGRTRPRAAAAHKSSIRAWLSVVADGPRAMRAGPGRIALSSRAARLGRYPYRAGAARAPTSAQSRASPFAVERPRQHIVPDGSCWYEAASTPAYQT